MPKGQRDPIDVHEARRLRRIKHALGPEATLAGPTFAEWLDGPPGGGSSRPSENAV
jgi:hypothetical protein